MTYRGSTPQRDFCHFYFSRCSMWPIRKQRSVNLFRHTASRRSGVPGRELWVRSSNSSIWFTCELITFQEPCYHFIAFFYFNFGIRMMSSLVFLCHERTNMMITSPVNKTDKIPLCLNDSTLTCSFTFTFFEINIQKIIMIKYIKMLKND